MDTFDELLCFKLVHRMSAKAFARYLLLRKHVHLTKRPCSRAVLLRLREEGRSWR